MDSSNKIVATLGIPREITVNERRVAGTPDTVKKLVKLGLAVLVEQGAGRSANFSDLAYEQAMAAERAGQLAEMERLLRQLMQRHPDYHHAYNALGYALADRNERLPEAKGLIQKALQAAPNDAYILDSLGWVEYRLGNLDEARRILQDAYRRQPDAEIAAHLGEVLWQLQQRQAAMDIWREGLLLNPDNQTLVQTLRRFQVQP